MKIVFLGSPEFAIKSLEALLCSKHDVVAVVTQPDKPAGRGKNLTPSDVKVYAKSKGLRVLEYLKISRDGVQDLKDINPDIMITAAYGQILSQEIIDIPRYGIINVHASLLPKYRGASPIQSAIINGETETGITIMQTEAGLDTGDILSAEKLEIGEYETAGELSQRLSTLGADLLLRTLDDIESGKIQPQKQSQVEATITTKIYKEDCVVNFNKSAKQVKSLVYGSNPDPIARAIHLNTKGEETIIKIHSVLVNETDGVKAEAGTIIEPTSAKNGVFVACGSGIIELKDIQFPGKGVVDAKTMVAGRKLNIGDKFIFRVSSVK